MSGTFGNAMAADTVDKDTQEWERIREAIAFRTTDEDEVFIVRKVDCPDCGHVYAMVLATGSAVHYGKRHKGCNILLGSEVEVEIDG